MRFWIAPLIFQWFAVTWQGWEGTILVAPIAATRTTSLITSVLFIYCKQFHIIVQIMRIFLHCHQCSKYLLKIPHTQRCHNLYDYFEFKVHRNTSDFCNLIFNFILLVHREHYNKLAQKRSGPRFNIKMPSYQHRKSHCGDKTIWRPSYLHNGISYTG